MMWRENFAQGAHHLVVPIAPSNFSLIVALGLVPWLAMVGIAMYLT
jgi:hypothetical protein